jgi:uncharacterized membrane protein YfcA
MPPAFWAAGAAVAFVSGIGKTGIPGIGILAVALFAMIFPARASVGIVLPLLICGDVVAVAAYRRHAAWKHLLRLFPWTALGVLPGTLLMRVADDRQVGWIIGTILLGLIALHLRRQRRTRPGGEDPDAEPPHGAVYTAFMGFLAGFTTMVANAAGPIMILYLLAMRLPKMEFVGTQAWFFFAVNVFKVPFSIAAHVITADSIAVSARLAAFMILGALAGRLAIRYLNQKAFEATALALTFVAATWLIARPWVLPPPPASRPAAVRDAPPARDVRHPANAARLLDARRRRPV